MKDEFKDNSPVPEKSIIVKNLLFGLFIILAIFFCFQKYFERAQQADLREGMKLYDSAIEMLNSTETQDQAFLTFNQAETYFVDALESARDQKNALKATQMLAQCYAMMATCPNVNGEKTIEYYQKALAMDLDCPLINDVFRLKYAPDLTPEMRAAIEERIRIEAAAIPSTESSGEAPGEPPLNPELPPLPPNPIPADIVPAQ